MFFETEFILMGRSRKDPYPPPPRRKFSLSEGGGRKNVLGCPKGGGGEWNVDMFVTLSEGLRL